VLLVAQWLEPVEEPWRSRPLNEAKQRLQAEPRNEELKKQIRTLDLELRRNYFRHLQRSRSGAWLLAASGVLMIWVARELARRPHAAPVQSPSAAPDREQLTRRARGVVVISGTVCAAVMAALGLASRSYLPADGVLPGAGPASAANGASSSNRPAATVVAAGPAPEVIARQWAQFRGPDGRGHAPTNAHPLLTWDVAAGQGVVWKAAVPLTGYNSPIVWDNRVFLTGGDKKARLVFCFDAASGALKWQRAVAPTNTPPANGDVPEQSGPAASSVATDGERVYAVFATGELGALDNEGNLVWHRRLDFAQNGYGHASSLALWQGRVLVQAHQGQPEEGKSALLAFDGRTGAPAWTAKQPVGGSWASPIVGLVAGRAQVLTSGDPWLMAHDPATGTELWRAKVLGGELAPSPVVADGVVFAASPGRAFSAVKADGTGDVTASHVAWRIEQEVPDVPSPLVVGDLVITASTEGRVIARERATGTKVWDQNLELEIQASPLLAAERIYLFAQPGDVVVLAAAREFKELARFKMGDEIYASPAVVGDRLYVRTKQSLFCVGENAGTTTKAADAH